MNMPGFNAESSLDKIRHFYHIRGMDVILAGQIVPQRQQRPGGSASEAECEVVSVGLWYCTIDGKGYYCDTNDKPDKNKNCIPAKERSLLDHMLPTAPINLSVVGRSS